MPARAADKMALAGGAALPPGAVLPIGVPRLLLTILEQRPDLSARFDIATAAGRDGYVTWCLTEGRGEYRAIADLARAGAFPGLHDPDPSCPIALPTALTGLMRLAWTARPDVQRVYPLPERAEDVVWWFFLHGARELGLDDLVPSAARADLGRPVLPPDEPGAPAVSRLMHRIWRLRPDLQASFDPRIPAGRIAFVRWFLTVGSRELDLDWLIGGAPAEAAPPAGCIAGIDLFGYARGELGIGEDVRMLSRALDRAAVEHSVVDVPPGPSVRQQDRRLNHVLAAHPTRRAVVFAMTGVETARVVATRGLQELAGRYVIGHWPWELPAWPKAWEGAYDLVDEIWATTTYTRDAYVERSPVPVVVMPPAVELPPGIGRWSRSAFGLPAGAFLFHFSFDFLSYPHRKNPWACVEAFARAFPARDEPVGLVIKTMRADRRSTAWRRLRARAAQDPRIVLIDRTMDRAETIALMAATDAYLSLHRAEGFGRGLAEAMLLGRPVIATGYSGSADFLTEDTGFPVDYRLVPVRRGQYPSGEGQRWAEPSVEHAAALMRRVCDDREAALAVAAAGRRHAEREFSPAAAGRRYRARLSALGLLDVASGGR